MKITHQLPTYSNKVSLADMKPGDVGIDDEGKYILPGGRLLAIELNPPGYWSDRTVGTSKFVTLLPPGTVITIEV